MYNKATKLLEKKNYLKALSFYKKQDPKFKECYLNMGNCYKMLGNNDKARECYVLASSDVPFSDGTYGDFALAYNNIGLLEYCEGRDYSAMQCYKIALNMNPLYYEAIWNYGNALLRSSNCVDGWEHYEYRFKRESGAVKIDRGIPWWDGKSTGKTILVQAEQGLGDKIMFGRYLAYLAPFFDEIVICCHESLDCLYAPYKCVRTTTGYDLTIGMCSLAGIFGVVPEGYLDGKFEKHPFTGFNIGVVWAGSSTHANNANRSCPSSYFSNLSNLGNLWSLSPDAGPTKNIAQLAPKTWSETASYCLGLDLVVSVDTSIVHLCGTLGVPCIMVQPLQETDFRWGKPTEAEFGNNRWYKSVMVVPNDNNWDAAFDVVRESIICLK
jgi:tetratricopeptide (TPR) repeat protein